MLTGKQRSYLKSLAHDLDDAVYIGKNEVTEATIKEIEDYIKVHELIKVKLLESALLDPKIVANDIAEKIGAEYVQAIGRKFVLYKRSEDEAKIVLPR